LRADCNPPAELCWPSLRTAQGRADRRPCPAGRVTETPPLPEAPTILGGAGPASSSTARNVPRRVGGRARGYCARWPAPAGFSAGNGGSRIIDACWASLSTNGPAKGPIACGWSDLDVFGYVTTRAPRFAASTALGFAAAARSDGGRLRSMNHGVPILWRGLTGEPAALPPHNQSRMHTGTAFGIWWK